MTLHVIFGDMESSEPSSNIVVPVVTDDVVVLVRPNFADSSIIEARYYRARSTTSPYATRRSIKTAYDNATSINDDAIDLFDKTLPDLRVYNLYDRTINQVLFAFFNSITSSIADKTTIPHLTDIMNNLTRGQFPKYLNVDGSDWVSPTPPPADIDTLFNTNTAVGILALVTVLEPAIKYLGFDPSYSRQVFLTKPGALSIVSLVRDLLVVFSAYAHIGNNINKLDRKRVNLEVSRKLMRAVNTVGIVAKATAKEHLTLPRMAICFMPQYLLFRKFIMPSTQNQTTSTIGLEFKDVCFSGCNAINAMPGYNQYNLEFSSYIYKPGEDTDTTDKKFLSNHARWLKVAKDGYAADTDIHAHMTDAIAATGLSKEQAIERITNQLTEYQNKYSTP